MTIRLFRQVEPVVAKRAKCQHIRQVTDRWKVCPAQDFDRYSLLKTRQIKFDRLWRIGQVLHYQQVFLPVTPEIDKASPVPRLQEFNTSPSESAIPCTRCNELFHRIANCRCRGLQGELNLRCRYTLNHSVKSQASRQD